MSDRKTDNETLVKSLRKLSGDTYHCADSKLLAEAADRIEEHIKIICIWFREQSYDLEDAGFEFTGYGNEDQQVIDFLIKHAEKH